MRRLFRIDAVAWRDHHMPKFMGKVEPLAFRPRVLPDNDHARGFAVLAADLGRQTVDVVQVEGHDLDAPLFEEFSELRNRVIAEAPVFSNRTGWIFSIVQIINGMWRAARLFPVDAAHP